MSQHFFAGLGHVLLRSGLHGHYRARIKALTFLPVRLCRLSVSWWDHGRCLGVGLSLGPMDPGGIRGGIAREDAHESRSTPQSTQVRGCRVEVRPLLLPLSLCISLYYRVKRTLDRVTMVLLELYPGYESAARELLV